MVSNKGDHMKFVMCVDTVYLIYNEILRILYIHQILLRLFLRHDRLLRKQFI